MAARWKLPPWRVPWPIPASWVLAQVLGEEWGMEPGDVRRVAPARWVERWLAWKDSIATLAPQTQPAQGFRPSGEERMIGL